MKYSPEKSFSLALSIFGITVVAALVIAGAFYWEFHADPIQHDSGAWANFASYFGGIFTPVIALINLAVLLFIVLVVTDQQQNQLASKRLALDMLAQWNGPELHESRRVISNLIKDTPDRAQLRTLGELEEDRSEQSLHAFRLYHFFEQWAVLASMKEIDHAILSTAIGSRAIWYRTHFFEPIQAREKDKYICKALELIEEHLFKTLL